MFKGISLRESTSRVVLCGLRSVLPAFAGLLLCGAAHAQSTMVGKVSGEFAVSPSGAATYRIPIEVPPGVAGMQPQLALSYSSQAGNGIMGMGWSIEGLSAITRCPRTLASDGAKGRVNYNSDDRFCLDGQRLINISGAYGAAGSEYRTELESFSRVTAYGGSAATGPDRFTVQTKAGLTMEYGATADARIEAPAGNVVRVWALNRMAAPSEAALRQTLATQGLTVLSVKAGKASGARLAGRAAARGRYALFCREVGTLIQAGMTVVEAVDTLSARERLAGRQDSLAASLLQRLQQGLSLSHALEQLPASPPVLVAAVRAGERTSDLAQALSDYLRFDTLVEQLRRKVVSASIYPALVSALGVGISLFLLLVVMPNFARMYSNLRGAASGATGWMIGLSQWVSQHQAFALGGLAVAVLALAGWIWSGAARRHLLALAVRLPGMRRRIEDFQLAMMYQALALMLKGGYPMTEALAVASRSALDVRLKTALGEALARIEQGQAVAQALFDAGLCDEVGRRLMAAAERNGNFHLAADVVSRLHGERFELFVERLTRIVEPLLLMAVALMVGSIVVAMYLPVFDMATRLR